MEGLVIGTIGVMALVFGIVEFAKKEFGLEGRKCQVLAAALGIVLSVLALAIAQGLIPPDVAGYVEMAVTAIAGTLAAMGYYNYLQSY